MAWITGAAPGIAQSAPVTPAATNREVPADPLTTPKLNGKFSLRPWLALIPAMLSVAGPGLAVKGRAARTRVRVAAGSTVAGVHHAAPWLSTADQR